MEEAEHPETGRLFDHDTIEPSAEMHFTWPDGQHRVTQPRGKPPKVPLPPV